MLMREFDDNEWEAILGMQSVQWMARCGIHLLEDLEALLKGHDAILNTYVECWISIQ